MCKTTISGTVTPSRRPHAVAAGGRCHRNRRNRTPLAIHGKSRCYRGGTCLQLTSTPGGPCFRWTRESAVPSAAARAVSARAPAAHERRRGRSWSRPRRLEFGASARSRASAASNCSRVSHQFSAFSAYRRAAARLSRDGPRSPKEATMVAPFCAIAMTFAAQEPGPVIFAVTRRPSRVGLTFSRSYPYSSAFCL